MKVKKLIVIILLLTVLSFCAGFFVPRYFATQKDEPASQEELPAPDPTGSSQVEEAIDGMSLDAKIAQMLIVQPLGQQLTDDMRTQLASAPYGGYILLADNMSDLASTRSYIQSLQQASKTPLIISTDQEGGLVQRLRAVTGKRSTYIPAMYDLGLTGNTELAKEVGRVMAEEMRVLGINVDFAPDADVFSNPNNTVIGRRSFSADPAVVSNMSYSLARGLEENGVTACYKHFPGHGNTSTDSHYSLPVIDLTREQLDQSDLIPFKNAITNKARMIMAGHIAMPKITGDNTPATLSKSLLTDLLRNELGFDGLIVTDSLNMGALMRNYSEADIYYRAIEAGADILLMPINPALAIQSIKDHISEERINESVQRIMQFKANYLSNYEYLDEAYFGSAEHADIVKQITAQ